MSCHCNTRRTYNECNQTTNVCRGRWTDYSAAPLAILSVPGLLHIICSIKSLRERNSFNSLELLCFSLLYMVCLLSLSLSLMHRLIWGEFNVGEFSIVVLICFGLLFFLLALSEFYGVWCSFLMSLSICGCFNLPSLGAMFVI